MDNLAATGIVLDRHYAFRYCSPSRSSFNSGRNPIHVNTGNDGLTLVNFADPVSGFAGIPRNMTCIGNKMSEAGYVTGQAGKCACGERAACSCVVVTPFPCLACLQGTWGLQRRRTPLRAAGTSTASHTLTARMVSPVVVCAPTHRQGTLTPPPTLHHARQTRLLDIRHGGLLRPCHVH